MLYLIDEYIAEYPLRQHDELLKFKSCEKNLHEMTLNEVNEIVSKWNPVSANTALRTKWKIAQYLDWLIFKKRQSIKFDIMEVDLPTKDAPSNYIFSTKDIQQYYDILNLAIERKAAMDGTNASNQIFKMTHAAGVLAFYGLTDKQILDLDLSDIQPEGVRGYNLPLTQEDINILMAYKNTWSYDGFHQLKGTKFIRTRVSDGSTIDSYFLNRPLSKVVVEEKYSYIKALLKTSQLNLFGKFNEVYRKEIKYGEAIPDIGKMPDWFKNIFKVSPNWLTKIRKQYIEYRDARDADEEAKESSDRVITNQLNEINSQIAELNKEAERLRKQLLK